MNLAACSKLSSRAFGVVWKVLAAKTGVTDARGWMRGRVTATLVQSRAASIVLI